MRGNQMKTTNCCRELKNETKERDINKDSRASLYCFFLFDFFFF
jgi:hypothetical protein